MNRNFRQIIALWPSIRQLTRDMAKHAPMLEEYYELTKAWHRRNSIPPEYWPALVAAAKARRISGVNYAALVQAAVIKSQEQDARRSSAGSRRVGIASNVGA